MFTAAKVSWSVLACEIGGAGGGGFSWIEEHFYCCSLVRFCWDLSLEFCFFKIFVSDSDGSMFVMAIYVRGSWFPVFPFYFVLF